MATRTRPKTGSEDEAELIERALRSPWDLLEHQAAATRRDVRTKALHHLEDAGRNEDRIRQEYTGRYPMELLQNAHDACADGATVGAVRFVVTDSALLVSNKGVPFTSERITSLVRHGSSEKALRAGTRHTIGYKGVGFDSVFEISDCPQIISSTARFGFDRRRAKREIARALGQVPQAVPVRYFPFRLDDAEWEEDREAVQDLLARGAVTVVRLPLRANRSSEQVRDDLQSSLTPEALLFADAVDELEIASGGGATTWRRRTARRLGEGTLVHLEGGGEPRSWVVARGNVALPRAIREQLRDPLWDRVPRVSFAAALPWRRRTGIDPDALPLPIHVYFPTDDRLGRALLVHGDFYVTSSRRRIETEGAGGAVSEVVAEGVARLAARLAESLCDQGYRLLSALAETGETEGFGARLGERLDERLAEARIARPADGGKPRRPSSVRRLDTNLRVAQEVLLASIVEKRGTLVTPGDDLDAAGDLLAALGSKTLSPTEIAERVDPRLSRASYETVLGVLGRWYGSLGWYGQQQVVQELWTRPIVQDLSGRWRRPTEVVERVEAGPPLPARVRKVEVRMPRGRFARTLVEELEIESLTPGRALSILLDAIEEEAFGQGKTEAESALAFVWALWEDHRETLKAETDRLGIIPVPARASKRRTMVWRPAGSTYFPRAWTGSTILEDAYGPFGEAEFLAETPPSQASSLSPRRQFFDLLGIASTPRWHEHRFIWQAPLRRFSEWRDVGAVQAAMACPEVHPQSGRSFVVETVDRLDELVERAESGDGIPVARALLELENPLGEEAVVRCAHSQHRSQKGKKAPGYQAWLLQTRPWVPVNSDPSGRASRSPREAWTNVPKSAPWLRVPRASIPDKEGSRLGLTSAERPSPEAVEIALRDLAEVHPELVSAPQEVVQSAAWLQDRLERALGQKKPESRRRVKLFARSGSEPCWSETPLIPDLPGVDTIPGLSVLPPGRWENFRRTYRLRLASDVVSVGVEATRAPGNPGVLGGSLRADLVALLTKRGADLGRLAFRLGRLRELPCRMLSLRMSFDGRVQERTRAFYLLPRRDSKNRLAGGTLYLDAGVEPDAYSLELARALADYLGDAAYEELIGLFLIAPHGPLLRDRGVSEAEVLEAEEALRRHRRGSVDGQEEATWPEPSTQEERATESEEQKPADTGKETAGELARPRDGTRAGSLDRQRRSAEREAVESTTGTAALRDERLFDPVGVSFGETTHVRSRDLERQRRPVAPPGRGGETRGSSTEPISDKEVELVDVDVAKEYGRSVLGAEVIDVQRYKRGWDLEFRFSDGREELVEVKGSSRQGRFILTRNELRAAREHANWVLLYVSNLLRGSQPRILRFPRFGEELDAEQQLDALTWNVSWEGLSHDVIELLPGTGST